MSTKIILIVATGRSGSTTLQRILNTIPDSNISGENWGAINNLLECYSNLKKTQQGNQYNKTLGRFKTLNELTVDNIKPCWYNNYDMNEITEQIKHLIVSIFNKGEKRVIGFKEIRYFGKLHMVNEFLELFPDTKVICHMRKDIKSQSESGWWKQNSSAESHLTEYNEQLQKYASNNNTHFISYFENMFDYENIQKLFEFINEPVISEEEYRNIITNNIKD